MGDTRKRGSRIYRLDNPPQMRLTERDIEVIKSVNDYRLMRQDQIQRLHFPSQNTAQNRLWKLWQNEFLKRHFLSVVGGVQNSPILYAIDKRGAELLKREMGYEKDDLRYSRNDVSHRFLEHTLGLSEIRLAVELSCKKHGYTFVTWFDEKKIKSDSDRVQVGKKHITVLPDAYFVIDIPGGKLHFFLEFDRGSESLAFFRKKIRMYWTYFQSGKCVNRYGTNLVRVLTVTEQKTIFNKGRLRNLKKVTQGLGVHTWFWFTTLNGLEKGDFLHAPIWRQTQEEKPKALIT